MTSTDPVRSAPNSTVADRLPRLWTLWTAARPSQLALIVVVYALGVGMATAGPPLIASGSAPVDASSTAFLASVLAGAIALLPVSSAIHYANEYADVETDALTVRPRFLAVAGRWTEPVCRDRSCDRRRSRRS